MKALMGADCAPQSQFLPTMAEGGNSLPLTHKRITMKIATIGARAVPNRR